MGCLAAPNIARFRRKSDDTHRVSARIWDQGDVINLRHLNDSLHKHGALGWRRTLVRRRACSLHGITRHSLSALTSHASEFEYLTYCHEADDDDIKHLQQPLC